MLSLLVASSYNMGFQINMPYFLRNIDIPRVGRLAPMRRIRHGVGASIHSGPGMGRDRYGFFVPPVATVVPFNSATSPSDNAARVECGGERAPFVIWRAFSVRGGGLYA